MVCHPRLSLAEAQDTGFVPVGFQILRDFGVYSRLLAHVQGGITRGAHGLDYPVQRLGSVVRAQISTVSQ